MAIKDLRDNLKRLKDADPVELAGQVNNWLHESGEAIRIRVEDEVEKAVAARGFIKRSEFQKLEARIAALEGKPKATKKAAKKVVKKAAPKKSAAKKGKK